MSRRMEADGGNPFTRFALGAGAASNSSGKAEVKRELPEVKTEVEAEAEAPAFQRGVKRQRSESEPARVKKASRATTTEDLQTKQEADAPSTDDKRLQLLRELLTARKTMTTPIDEFGTQACVAPGVTNARVERFQLLVAALLSSQTQDAITHAAMQRLHVHSRQLALEEDEPDATDGLTPGVVLATSEQRLDELLQPVGFHRRKAQQLRRVAAMLRQRHGDDVPRSLDELLALPGVGPKIARVVLLLAWQQVDGLVVDTHVHRLARRLGWTQAAASAEQTRVELESWIPREYWGGLSRAVVGFGQHVCTAKSPRCASCPLAERCPSAFKETRAVEKHSRRV